jgi:hypothetical protein
MLEVIHSRGLPLDRITTTDVWATDTISANLPSMGAFKERMDQRIWDMYRIEVEHLCARNKDGSKKTYEQMFYHVPVRRSQSVQVERERERRFRADSILGFPDLWNPWCQAGLKRSANVSDSRIDQGISWNHRSQLVPETQTCQGSTDSQFKSPLKWDLDSPVTFKADGHTVHDFDKRFRMEQEGYIDTYRPFRWEMLSKPPKFRATNFEEISLFDARGGYGWN